MLNDIFTLHNIYKLADLVVLPCAQQLPSDLVGHVQLHSSLNIHIAGYLHTPTETTIPLLKR